MKIEADLFATMMKQQTKFILRLFFLLFPLLISLPLEARVVTLQNGDQLSGEVVSETEREITLHHTVLGVLTIPKNQLRTKPPAPKTSKPPEITAKSTRMAPKLLGLFSSGFLEGWTRRVAVGIKGEDGNDVSLDISFGLDASYRDEADRLVLSSAYYYETEDREKDTSKGHINFVRDWLLPKSEWFYYYYFRYEYDSFKSWKHRVSLSGGPGYDFYRGANLEFSGRLGLGASRTWGTENEFDPEGQIGLEWTWKPPALKNHSLSSQFIIYPILNDLGEYRTWIQSKWKIDFDFFRGMGIELGFEHEYESESDKSIEGERYYDLICYGRFGLDF